jgi:rubrerythrin
VGLSPLEAALGQKPAATCETCHQPLHRPDGPQSAWVHPEGGATAYECQFCGHITAPETPTRCPKCNAFSGLQEDHVALPVID